MSPLGSFGFSPLPRNTRPHQVKWRVGQVVRHIKYGYRGVIIGWDEYCKVFLFFQ